MALWSEPVERAAHVNLFSGIHVEEGEVDGGAAGVPAPAGDVAAEEQHAFGKVRVKVSFHQRVL